MKGDYLDEAGKKQVILLSYQMYAKREERTCLLSKSHAYVS